MPRKSDHVLWVVHQIDQPRNRCLREGWATQVCGETTWQPSGVGRVSDNRCSSDPSHGSLVVTEVD